MHTSTYLITYFSHMWVTKTFIADTQGWLTNEQWLQYRLVFDTVVIIHCIAFNTICSFGTVKIWTWKQTFSIMFKNLQRNTIYLEV